MEHPPKQGLKLNCDNLLNHRLDFPDDLRGMGGGGKGGDQKRTRGPAEKELAADAIGQSQL